MEGVVTDNGNWFQRLPSPVAFFVAALAAATVAILFGLLAGWGSIYLYDRGDSKGNDLAVGLSALSAVSTFFFVVAFSWLSKLRRKIGWGTPLCSVLICFGIPICLTALMWDPYYAGYILAGWLVILLSGLSALAVARSFVTTEEDWAEKKLWNRTKRDSER